MLRQPLHPALPLFAAALSASLAAQSALLQVGPTRPFATIQAAVAAANAGDAIEVDPGTYAAFTIVGKRLAVFANRGGGGTPTFTVTGAPAITITGLASGDCVTIADALVTSSAAAPSILIDNQDQGHVRLLDVRVLAQTLGVVPFAGLIEARHTTTVWLDGVRAGDHRFRANGLGGSTGLAGLFVDACALHLTRCVLEGMRSDDPALDSGEGLGIVGGGTAWLVDCSLLGGLPPLNALPGVHGGHAIHDRGGQSGPIRACDNTLGPTDPAAAVFAVGGAPAFLAACLPDSIVRTRLPTGSGVLAVGTTTNLTVQANVPGRAFVTLLAGDFGTTTAPFLTGDLLIAGSFGILAGGVLTGPTSITLPLPPAPTLTGLHGTAQTVLVEATFITSTAAGFVVR